MKILIVDDQPKQLKLLRAVLESKGFAVLQAADGIEALQLLESEGADAIISDILMPRMDGYRLCYEVRKSVRFRGLPIIIYTSTYTTEMDEKLSLDLGADMFLPKPSSESTIAAGLHKLISEGRRGGDRPQAAMPDTDVLKEYSDRLISKLEERNQDLNQMVAELRTSAARLQTVSRRLFEVQEEERRHLARELHDEIGQALTAAKINLQSITGSSGGSATLARLQESIAILDRLVVQVRQISLDLRPSMLDDLGLVPALRSLLDEQGRRASIAVGFSAEDMPENLEPEIQTTCFRIAQEAITNAVRHADATQIDVDLRRDDENLRFVIRDNGTGFDAKSAQAQTVGLGLIGIKERAALVGGRARIISSPNKGTTIEVSLPLVPRPERQGGHPGK